MAPACSRVAGTQGQLIMLMEWIKDAGSWVSWSTRLQKEQSKKPLCGREKDSRWLVDPIICQVRSHRPWGGQRSIQGNRSTKLRERKPALFFLSLSLLSHASGPHVRTSGLISGEGSDAALSSLSLQHSYLQPGPMIEISGSSATSTNFLILGQFIWSLPPFLRQKPKMGLFQRESRAGWMLSKSIESLKSVIQQCWSWAKPLWCPSGLLVSGWAAMLDSLHLPISPSSSPVTSSSSATNDLFLAAAFLQKSAPKLNPSNCQPLCRAAPVSAHVMTTDDRNAAIQASQGASVSFFKLL